MRNILFRQGLGRSRIGGRWEGHVVAPAGAACGLRQSDEDGPAGFIFVDLASAA
jgi:hypothetical protein